MLAWTDEFVRPYVTQRANQQFRFIRDDRVHAPLCELTHAVGAIHRPDHDSLPCRMNQFDQFSIRQIGARNHPLRRHLAPAAKLILRLAKKSQRNRGIKIVDCREHVGKKRRNYISLLRRMLAQLCERLRLQARNLQLDIEKRPVSKLLQNIFQCGQRQALRHRFRNLNTANGRIMTDDWLAHRRKAAHQTQSRRSHAVDKARTMPEYFQEFAGKPGRHDVREEEVP